MISATAFRDQKIAALLREVETGKTPGYNPMIAVNALIGLSKEHIAMAIEAMSTFDGKKALQLSNQAIDYFVEGTQITLSMQLAATQQAVSFSLSTDSARGFMPSTDRQCEVYAITDLSMALASRATNPDNISKYTEAASVEYERAANFARLNGETGRAERLSAYSQKLKAAKAGEIVLPWMVPLRTPA